MLELGPRQDESPMRRNLCTPWDDKSRSNQESWAIATRTEEPGRKVETQTRYVRQEEDFGPIFKKWFLGQGRGGEFIGFGKILFREGRSSFLESYPSFNWGLVAFSAGRWGRGERLLLNFFPLSRDPHLIRPFCLQPSSSRSTLIAWIIPEMLKFHQKKENAGAANPPSNLVECDWLEWSRRR